jgi:hypothetical protein
MSQKISRERNDLMKRTGWEHYELEKEMSKTNIAGMLELFKREDNKFSAKCAELVQSFSKLTDEGKNEIENECKLLDEARQKIALRIAESLTKIDKKSMTN